MLTENQVLKFQKIYKERFGREISKKEAYEQGVKLLNLMKIMIDTTSVERRDQNETLMNSKY